MHDELTKLPMCMRGQPIFNVQSMENVQRAGICGNGMCEKGERCDPSSKSAVHKANHTCCLKDCPYVSLTCPISLTGPHPHKACGGNGICLDASGQCSCFLGSLLSFMLKCTLSVLF